MWRVMIREGMENIKSASESRFSFNSHLWLITECDLVLKSHIYKVKTDQIAHTFGLYLDSFWFLTAKLQHWKVLCVSDGA